MNYKIVLTFSNTSILLCGDWNVVLDRYMDTYNIIHNRNPYSFELLDPWRTRYPDERKYTWRQYYM
jgi:exonuclease III